MNKYMKVPDVTLYAGMKVDKSSTLEWESEDKKIRQELKGLEFTCWEKIEGESFETERRTTVHLKEGMVVLFEDEKRGFVVPVDKYVRIGEALEDLQCIQDLDME